MEYLSCTHKVCTKCSVNKPLEEFSKSKDKYNSWCKQCRREYESARRREKGVLKKIEPFVDHQSKQCLHCMEIKLFDQFSPSPRGRNGLSSYCKKCVCLRLDSDEAREHKRKHTKAYRDRLGVLWKAKHRIHQFNRRSKIKATDDGTVTREFLEELMLKEFCCWCHKFTDPKDRTIEHLKELISGGAHSAKNIDMACFGCNSARKGKYELFKRN